MKAYDVVGYACDGACYCEDCYVPSDNGSPIFASDEFDTEPVCDGCGGAIEGVTILGPDPDEVAREALEDAHYGKHAPEGNGDGPINNEDW